MIKQRPTFTLKFMREAASLIVSNEFLQEARWAGFF